MVTKQQAAVFLRFTHALLKNADGTPQRFRAISKLKTWKTRPGEFRLSVARGLRDFMWISHLNNAQWHVEGLEHLSPDAAAVATDQAIEGQGFVHCALRRPL